MSGYLKPEFVESGNVTESKYYILVGSKEESDKFINILNSEEIIEYLKLCKYSGFNSRKVLENI